MCRRWHAMLFPFALLTFIVVTTELTAFCFGKTQSSLLAMGLPSRSKRQLWTSSSDLGVRIIQPIFAVIPETRDGCKNVTVLLTIWLKRVGARAALYDLPYQAQDSIRLTVWVDNPSDLHNRQYGHLKLPVDHADWMPHLLFETSTPGPVLRAEYEPQAEHRRMVIDHIIRPYSFRVNLPHGIGDCFKIIEVSYPMHKASICLPPAKLDPTCEWLAPPTKYNITYPALYTAIGAVRHTGSTRDWVGYQDQVAVQLWNYITYQVAMGATGLLLYADELQRNYLSRNPNTAELLRRGYLRLIDWDMHERGHLDDDGRGRPLGYNYDQALFASHVNLGLSACGANLWVIVTDIDEYIYVPTPGRRWPEPLHECMEPAAPNITIHSLQRFEVLSSTIQAEEERRYWITPGALGGKAPGDSSGHGISSSAFNVSFVHPLEFYDQVFAQPLSRIHGKAIVQPAARTTLFFVHDAVPLHGKTHVVHQKCMVLLHVPNFHGARRKPLENMKLQPFQNWVFGDTGMKEATAGLEE